MREVEREHGHRVPFGKRHHSGIDETEVEIRVLRVEFDGSSQQTRGHEGESVVTNSERAEKQARLRDSNPISDDVIDLDRDRIRDDEVPSETTYERSCKPVRGITTVESRDERPGIGDDAQRFASASRRYSSTRRLRSGGPSPEPT